MASDHRLLDAERIQQADHVAEMMQQGITVDLLRRISLSVATHVGREPTEAGRGQRAQLMAPGIPELGKPVAQHDERTLPRFGHMHPDAVGLDGAMRHFCHRA